MVQKMLPPLNKSATALGKETGVCQSTLSSWLRQARSVVDVGKVTGKRKRTAAEKLQLLIEAATLKEGELGELLRREGLHEAQLRQWRSEAEAGLTESSRKRDRPEAKRIRQLERELHRKERALAEAAALLVLKKKASAIWGDGDGDTEKENEP